MFRTYENDFFSAGAAPLVFIAIGSDILALLATEQQ